MALFSNEVCKTCEILKEALEFERARNQELTETLTSLVKPVPIIQQTVNPQAINRPVGLTWTRRREALENQDRLRVQAEASPLAAKPDIPKSNGLNKLERELGVVDSDNVDQTKVEERQKGA